jgi:hypothetical protein
MSSYSLQGDDVLFDGLWTSIKKVAAKSPIGAAVKFIANPIKGVKEASKTIARFDPTSKTAKYGNFTKGVLAGAALTVAAVATGGGALAVAGGVANAAATARKISITPVRKPAKGVTPPVIPNAPGITTATKVPLNAITSAPALANPADRAIAVSAYTDSAKKPDNSKLLIIGGAAAISLVVFILASKGA